MAVDEFNQLKQETTGMSELNPKVAKVSGWLRARQKIYLISLKRDGLCIGEPPYEK